MTEHSSDARIPNYDSWDSYDEQLSKQTKPRSDLVDYGAFLPDPNEVTYRCEALKWMSFLGFSPLVQDSVMIHDCPSIERVRKLVKRYGPRKAHDRLYRFLKG